MHNKYEYLKRLMTIITISVASLSVADEFTAAELEGVQKFVEMSPQQNEEVFEKGGDNAESEVLGVLTVDGKQVIQDWLAERDDADTTQGRRARSSNPRNTLWVDVYQESDVTLKYIRRGQSYRTLGAIPEQTVPMSFAVVTKIDANGNKQFLRAHLVSPGAYSTQSVPGTFDIDRRHRYYTSRTYGSRMDFAQFFIGGIALHQTDTSAYRILGGPASHGCIRHHKLDAEAMWNIIGAAIQQGHTVNIKVNRFGAAIADYTRGSMNLLTKSLNRSIACTRYANKYSTRNGGSAGSDNAYCTRSTSIHNYSDSGIFSNLF